MSAPTMSAPTMSAPAMSASDLTLASFHQNTPAAREFASPTPVAQAQAASTASSISTIAGRLIHSNRDEDPAGSQRIQLVSPGSFFSCDTIVDSTETDRNGHFKFVLQLPQRSGLYCSSTESFVLRVIEETAQVRNWRGQYEEGECVVDNLGIELSETDDDVQLGDHSIDLYAYQKGLPALLQPHDPSLSPQQWNMDFILTLAKAGFESILTKSCLDCFCVTDPATILRSYNAPVDPHLSLTGADTIEMLLNGICPGYFQRTNDPNIYTVEINWDRYETDPEQTGPRMVNATLAVRKSGDDLEVHSVTIQEKGATPTTYTPGGQGFSRALYLFNSMAAIKGQAHYHLGRGHFVTEQNAMAAYKFLNRNNFKHLVRPHMRGVMEIDRVGSKAIFGDETSVLVRSTGLTAQGLSDALRDTLAGTCYTTFRPKAPFAANDRFARAGNLFWDLTHEAVEEFFRSNAQNIEENWNEIFYMSKALVQNSLPYRPLEGKDHDVWADGNEIDDPAAPGRVVFDGELRAMRPITLSRDAPQAGDIERLKQFARFAIYTATFWHWVVHASQGKWMTNFGFGSLAPQAGGGAENYGNTRPEHMTQILTLSGLLTRFTGGSIIQNENGDIYQGIITRLAANREEFAALGFNIDKCFYGTII
jgi:hypothetical protein